MVALAVVVGLLVGVFYFGMVFLIRPETAKMEARGEAFRVFVRASKLGSGSSEEVRRYLDRLDELEHQVLMDEFEAWPQRDAEVRVQLLARIYPKRRVLWPAVLISSVLVAIVVSNSISPPANVWEELLFVLLVLFAPWYVSTGSVDVADRVWRRSRRVGSV